MAEKFKIIVDKTWIKNEDMPYFVFYDISSKFLLYQITNGY